MPLVESITLMFRRNSRRLSMVLLVTVAMAIAMPLLNLYVIYPAFTDLLTSAISEDAARLARYSRPPSLRHTILSSEALNKRFFAEIYKLEHDFGLHKIRIFSAAGEIIYSTNPEEVGQINTSAHFTQRIARGEIFTQLVTRNAPTLEGETLPRDVIETYVPFMRGNRFLGAFELYYDVTNSMERLDELILYSTIGTTALSLSLLVVVAIMLKKEAAKTEAQEHAARLKDDVERITRHDLKSPFISLLNGIHYLQEFTQPDEDQSSILVGMHAAAREGLNLINLSLDLYKMETSNYSYTPEPVDILTVARRVLADLDGLADSMGVTVRLMHNGRQSEPGDTLEMYAEETLCYSLLANLLKNAIEASKDGDTVTLTVADNDAIEITIHNQAPVPETMREVFFQKYTTSGKSGGTGLGTYSARLMARTMGGLIAMRTSDREGTTITVTLPKTIANTHNTKED